MQFSLSTNNFFESSDREGEIFSLLKMVVVHHNEEEDCFFILSRDGKGMAPITLIFELSKSHWSMS